MKMDVRTSVALCLFAVTATAGAQNAPQQTAPPPAQTPPPSAQPPQDLLPAYPPGTPAPTTPTPPPAPVQQQNVPPPPPPSGVPQSPPPARYPTSPQYQYTPPAQTAPPPPPPPAVQPAVQPPPQWSHSETSYPAAASNGFQYHPFRFHIDGGGTLPEQSNETNLQAGWNAGAGFSIFPSSHVPLGIRIDGTYNEFIGTNALMNQASATYGTPITRATEKLYGGDTDLELDLQIGSHVREYLIAGGGWYRDQITYRQTSYQPGFVCSWWACGPGYYGVTGVVARTQSDWHFAKNAGIGFEFAMAPKTSFFVEARYMRLDPNNAKSDFVPIRAGLRF
jgi:hypothetical protein